MKTYGVRIVRGPWLWHALLDGTRLCRCPRSRWYRGGPGPVEHRDADGYVTHITWDGPDAAEASR